MRELSLHILDIAQNSISAHAESLRIAIIEDLKCDKLLIKIKDDGDGMDSEILKKVVDPFYTTRTTRKVGLGIPMYKAKAENCNGSFSIKSEVGIGTEVDAEFEHSHIDRVPLGNMADTIITIILSNPNMELIYTHMVNEKKFTLNTKEIKKILGDVPISNLEVISWLKEYLKEGLQELLIN
ncbi:ATP-binding protein [Helicovermis profundi]|uniref:histidine kinase n=1 Tax=Helicovermis profundi TaxID=3065157 RepID=A0AAU9ETU3_9FIRM|nr:ATP-binding protein [Clostridia bacterium S502]